MGLHFGFLAGIIDVATLGEPFYFIIFSLSIYLFICIYLSIRPHHIMGLYLEQDRCTWDSVDASNVLGTHAFSVESTRVLMPQ